MKKLFAKLCAVVVAACGLSAFGVTTTTTTYGTGEDAVTFNGDIWTWNNYKDGESVSSANSKYTKYSDNTVTNAGNASISGVGSFYNYFFYASEQSCVGNTLRFDGATADIRLNTDWTKYVWIGGLIAETGDYTYTFGRNSTTSFKLKGTGDVNILAKSNLKLWTTTDISVESSGTWKIADGKTLTLQCATATVGSGVNLAISGGTLKTAATIANSGTVTLGSMAIDISSLSYTEADEVVPEKNGFSGAARVYTIFSGTGATVAEGATVTIKDGDTVLGTFAAGSTVTTYTRMGQTTTTYYINDADYAFETTGATKIIVNDDADLSTILTGNTTANVIYNAAVNETDAIAIAGRTLTLTDGGTLGQVNMNGNGGTINFYGENSTYTMGQLATQSSDNFTRNIAISNGVTVTMASVANAWGLGQVTVDGTLNVTGECGFRTGDNGTNGKNWIGGTGSVTVGTFVAGNVGTYNIEVATFNADTVTVNRGTLNLSSANGSIPALNVTGGTANISVQKNITAMTASGGALNISGNIENGTITRTSNNARINYSGASIKNATLDGVVLTGNSRVTTSEIVTIKNMVSNALTGGTYGYAFLGSGTINFEGANVLDTKSDGTQNTFSKLGYGKDNKVVIKTGASLQVGGIVNSTTVGRNGDIEVQANATLTTTDVTETTFGTYAETFTNNGTSNMGGTLNANTLVNNGTLNLTKAATVNTKASGSGSVVLKATTALLTIPSGSTATVSTDVPGYVVKTDTTSTSGKIIYTVVKPTVYFTGTPAEANIQFVHDPAFTPEPEGSAFDCEYETESTGLSFTVTISDDYKVETAGALYATLAYANGTYTVSDITAAYAPVVLSATLRQTAQIGDVIYTTFAKAIAAHNTGVKGDIIILDKTAAIPDGWYNVDGKLVESNTDAVAQIGTAYYTTLAGATSAAKAGDTITMLKATETETAAVSTSIRIAEEDNYLKNATITIAKGTTLTLSFPGGGDRTFTVEGTDASSVLHLSPTSESGMTASSSFKNLTLEIASGSNYRFWMSSTTKVENIYGLTASGNIVLQKEGTLVVNSIAGDANISANTDEGTPKIEITTTGNTFTGSLGVPVVLGAGASLTTTTAVSDISAVEHYEVTTTQGEGTYTYTATAEKYTVTFPTTPVTDYAVNEYPYTVITSLEVAYGDSVEIAAFINYEDYEPESVKIFVNKAEVTVTDWVFTISGLTSNAVVTATGTPKSMISAGEVITYETAAEAQAAADKINNAASKSVYIKLPPVSDSSTLLASDYYALFTAKVVDGNKVVVTFTDAAAVTLTTQVNTTVKTIDPLTTDDETITTTPGLYYTILGGTVVGTITEEGTEVLADTASTTLSKPDLKVDGVAPTAAFYKIRVSEKKLQTEE